MSSSKGGLDFLSRSESIYDKGKINKTVFIMIIQKPKFYIDGENGYGHLPY